MKIINDVNEILSKYDLKKIDFLIDSRNLYEYLNKHPEEESLYKTTKDDNFLFNKYRKHIPKGWYGFSIGHPIKPEWVDIIDEILELCVKLDESFEIHQIKIKYGGISFYVESDVIEDIDNVSYLLSETLFDKALIY